MNKRLLVVTALAMLTSTEAAHARHHKHRSLHAHHHHVHHRVHHRHRIADRARDANGNDARPAEWCGWYMRQQFGVKDRAANLALWWAHYGRPAPGPAVGVIVVWSRGRGHGHVGVITAQTPEGWRVKSGNDGHAVRDRVRSVKGAYAFRWPA